MAKHLAGPRRPASGGVNIFLTKAGAASRCWVSRWGEARVTSEADIAYLREFVRQVCGEPDIAARWEAREPALRDVWRRGRHEIPWSEVRRLIEAECIPHRARTEPRHLD